MTTTERTCETCPAALPPRRPGARGPLARFCEECKKDRHNERVKARYVPRERPKSMPNMQRYKPGERFGSLVIVERIAKRSGSQRVHVHCDCGNERELGLTNLTSGVTTNCADRKHHPDPRRKSTPGSYSSAHHRVAETLGRAAEYQCVRCDRQAEHWAFVHAEPDLRRDVEGKEAGRPYSVDPRQYEPMCRRCHVHFDRAHAQHAGGGLSLVHRAFWLAKQDRGDVEPKEEAAA